MVFPPEPLSKLPFAGDLILVEISMRLAQFLSLSVLSVALSACGMMWTETRRAPVETGDIIFLPAEQEHSLECTEDSGMVLAGHYYPSGEPNINY